MRRKKTKVIIQRSIVFFFMQLYILICWPRFVQRRVFNAKMFSYNLTAFSLKRRSWIFGALKCVMSAQYQVDVWIRQSSCCSSGSTMAPQNSGNGPDGSHPPVTRSPMAQERGMCMCVATIWCLALSGRGIVNVVCQGEYKAQRCNT